MITGYKLLMFLQGLTDSQLKLSVFFEGEFATSGDCGSDVFVDIDRRIEKLKIRDHGIIVADESYRE